MVDQKKQKNLIFYHKIITIVMFMFVYCLFNIQVVIRILQT